MSIPDFVDSISSRVARLTVSFVHSRSGEIFLSLILFGPLTFLPTVYQAWTAPNIDAFRTLTWPLMIIVNLSSFLAVAHNGDWRMRLVTIAWMLLVFLVFLATLVR